MSRIKRVVIEGDRIEVEFFDEEDRNNGPFYLPYTSTYVQIPYTPYDLPCVGPPYTWWC